MVDDNLDSLRSLLDRLETKSRARAEDKRASTQSSRPAQAVASVPGTETVEILPPADVDRNRSQADQILNELSNEIFPVRRPSTVMGTHVDLTDSRRSAETSVPLHSSPVKSDAATDDPAHANGGASSATDGASDAPFTDRDPASPADGDADAPRWPASAPGLRDEAVRDLDVSEPAHQPELRIKSRARKSEDLASGARLPVGRPVEPPPETSKRSNVERRNRAAPSLGAVHAPIRAEPAPFSGRESPTRESAPSDSIKRPALFGWIVIALFFGVLGGWAVLAPLHGAVVANGVIKIEGNRKSVQHLDGGIVKLLSIREGDRVKAGDVLMVLDDSQARAEFQVLQQQFYVLRASAERLKTELAHGKTLAMPADLRIAQEKDPEIANIWKGQLQQFESRLAALEGQRSVIRERIAQYEAQIKGGEAQLKAYESQAQSVQKELESIAPLVEKGLIATPRRLQLERSGAQLEGQAAETGAGIAKARQAIAEQRQQIAQLDNERLSEVSRELKETQAKELETLSRLANARAVLSRTEIRAPYSGQVVGLNVFSVGGVIMRGDKILDLVPDQDALVIEAQIPVEDISDVHPDMQADVHLTAYKQRITPVVQGTVIQVSADRLVDSKTNMPYYTALIRLNEEQLAELPHVKLYPGMPATVMVRTVERTALDYIVGPLVMSFNKAFRQK